MLKNPWTLKALWERFVQIRKEPSKLSFPVETNDEECSCTPISDACPVCRKANQERYKDEIPF